MSMLSVVSMTFPDDIAGKHEWEEVDLDDLKLFGITYEALQERESLEE